MSAAGMGPGPESCGTWKNLLESLGLTLRNSGQNAAGGGEALPTLNAGAENAPEQSSEHPGPVNEVRILQRGTRSPGRITVEISVSPPGAVAVPARSGRAEKASVGHAGKAKPAHEAGAPAGADSPPTSTELMAAPPAAIALPSTVSPQTTPADRAAPGGEDPLRVPGTGSRELEGGAWPNGDRTGGFIAITSSEPRPPSVPVPLSEASTTRDTLAAESAPAGVEDNAHEPSASRVFVAVRVTETKPDSLPAEAAGSASPPGKPAPLPIPTQPVDSAGRSTATIVSPFAGRASNSVKDPGAKPATLKIASNPGRGDGPSFANESVFLNAPALRDPGAVPGMAEKHGSAPQRMGAPASDPFDALDTIRSAPQAWIRSGAHHAEAGYLDPALGWVSVRADVAGSGVHAALVPASGEAAQVLGSHLAGLNTYLSEHHREPATVTMASPQDARDASGTGPGTHAGQGDSARQDRTRDSQSMNGKASASVPLVSPAVSETSTARALPQGGTYISVMA